MSKQQRYQVNPLEKIDQIENSKVRDLCKIAVEEAIKMTERAASRQAISQRLLNIINVNVARLSKED